MTTIALVGAGGKMGCRITDNLIHHPDYHTHYLEVSPAGLERLAQRGLTPANSSCLAQTEVMILAVPDVAIAEVSRTLVPRLRPGALVLGLDPAAPLDGKLFLTPDVLAAVAHPCHPSIFNWEPNESAFRDFYGGVSAKQAAVLAPLQGGESACTLAEQITRAIYAPVSKVHRLTLEQMALLEPALVETLAQTCMEMIKQGHDRVIEKGVPPEAARDFVLGHLRIQIAVLFQETQGGFSDAAYKISRRARSVLFREGWEQIFEPADLREQLRCITDPGIPR